MQNPQEQVEALNKTLEQEQQARQTAEAAVKASEKARQEFVALVTHELRVPMTSIKGYTDLLIKGIMGPVNEAQANFLNTIRSNVERMSKMVADLADINKIAGQELKLNRKSAPLDAALLEETLKSYKKELEQKSQTFTPQIADDLPPLDCDRFRLIQILGNLISNAIKYTPENGIIKLIAELNAEDEIHIRIVDNGYGILEEEQSHIFEQFFRASDEETRATPGNGLSLHLTRLLLTLHQGKIWFESQRGQGSTFHITLPSATETTAQ